AVCAGEGIEQSDITSLLAQLVDRSLIVVEEHDGRARYRLTGPLHQLARESLAVSGETDRIQERLAAFYSALSDQAQHELMGLQRTACLDRLEQEYDNLHAVLQWLATQGRADQGLRLLNDLIHFWLARHLNEGQQWFAEFLALPHATPRTALRAEALDN